MKQAWLKENGKLEDICDLLVEIELAKSRSEARRLIEQGGVKIDGEVIKDYKAILIKNA